MLYELRIYHAVPGRLPDLLKRFDTITLGIWKKHGIEQAGFWTTGIGDSNQTLYYFLKWDSLADREKKWNAFQADPQWISARAETEKKGPIVARVENSILQPTNFSAVKIILSQGHGGRGRIISPPCIPHRVSWEGEPLGAVHRAPGRHHLADDRRGARRIFRLHAPPGGAAAAG